MSRDTVFEHALALSPDDRVRLIDELVQSIVAPAGCPELTPAQQSDLLARLDADQADPAAAVAWEEAEKRITSRAVAR